MENFLWSESFDGGDITTGNWEHWLKTFNNFISSLSEEISDKLILLTNYVSLCVCL